MNKAIERIRAFVTKFFREQPASVQADDDRQRSDDKLDAQLINELKTRVAGGEPISNALAGLPGLAALKFGVDTTVAI